MENEVIELLRQTDAILTGGHFVGTSGLHMDTYVNKDALFPQTKETSRIGKLFAEQCKDVDIDVVVAPALGGILLSQWTAYHLSQMKNKEILGVYTEKNKEGGQIFTRGYDRLVRGKKVLVVEDVTTTGESVKKVLESVRKAGGNVVFVCVMVNKNPKEVRRDTIGAPFSALLDLQTETFEAGNCPLCKKGISINTEIGHGKNFN
jgi:orotate phosphoribosyltransferase